VGQYVLLQFGAIHASQTLNWRQFRMKFSPAAHFGRNEIARRDFGSWITRTRDHTHVKQLAESLDGADEQTLCFSEVSADARAKLISWLILFVPRIFNICKGKRT